MKNFKEGDQVEMTAATKKSFDTIFTTGTVTRVEGNFIFVKRDGYKGHENTKWDVKKWEKSWPRKTFVEKSRRNEICRSFETVNEKQLKLGYFKILKETAVNYVKLDISMDDKLKVILLDYANLKISDNELENLLIEWAIVDLMTKFVDAAKRKV